jgi:hypothetical protein
VRDDDVFRMHQCLRRSRRDVANDNRT